MTTLQEELTFDYEVRCVCKQCGKPFTEVFYGINMAIKEVLGNSPVPYCNACTELRTKRKEQQERKQYLATVFEKANIPFCYLQNFDSGRGNNDLLNFILDNSGKTLYIAGNPGIGKTWAVCEAAKRMILARIGKTFLFLNWEEAVKDYLSACDEGENVGQRWRRSLLTADVIIIDDFGKGSFCQRSVDLFYYLTNKVYESLNKKIWITANLPAKEYILTIRDEKMQTDFKAACSRLLRLDNFTSWKQ